MRRVIIESPYAGDVQRNVAYARACVKDCLRRGDAPMVSHLLYTQPDVLDDGEPAERALGMHAGHAWIDAVDAMVLYLDLGISPGMQAGLRAALSAGLSIEVRMLYSASELEVFCGSWK